ncbi:nicotinamidase-related amidase [Lachnotalea glycerini]|uniref:nicotinamidase n=1 Tax=Lachnotalea glycerini TaxID=1763509 RepID=A0A318EWV2_9FIRM|nr:isochorismatase family cysteine hydrolase [Lachnotalea glycerini]PXV95556.1 nicotinamidase-related amidase [Lachnotalea glycerini]
MKNKVLIVVDMQKDFIDGALGSERAVSIVKNVEEKIKTYHDGGNTVIFTRDTHGENYVETQEGRNLPVYHCIKGTSGWEISSKLNTIDAVIIDKPTFGSVELMKYLSDFYPEREFELVGLCTDICVISNAIMLKAFLPEAKVSVDAACCAGVTLDSHKNALEAMKMCQIYIINDQEEVK